MIFCKRYKSKILQIVFVLFSFIFIFSQKNEKIGVCTHFDQGWDLNIMSDINDFGCGWIRDGVNWNEVEKTKGIYELPEKTKLWLTFAKNYNIKVLLVLAGGNTLYYDNYDKKAFSDFANFVVKNYGNYFNAIEILNEPNNSGFSQYYENGMATFNGLDNKRGKMQSWVAKYVDLLNFVAAGTKKINPLIKVVGLGSLPPQTLFQLNYGLNSYVDGITDHPYSVSAEFMPFANTIQFQKRDQYIIGDSVGTYYSYIKNYQTLLENYKSGKKKLWLTEFGFTTTGKENLTQEYQSENIVKRLIESNYLKVDKFFIYSFRDNCSDIMNKECGFGLIDTKGKSKKSYNYTKKYISDSRESVSMTNKELSINNQYKNSFSNSINYRIYKFNENGKIVFYIWGINNYMIDELFMENIINFKLTDYYTNKTLNYKLFLRGKKKVLKINDYRKGSIIKLVIN